MRGGITTWTEGQVETLKYLWAGGDSASVIANQMGITRNAVLGKVHRLELTPRAPRNGAFYGTIPKQTDRRVPNRITRASVFKNRGEKTPHLDVPAPNKTPPLVAVISAITGTYSRSKKQTRPYEPEYTKDQLRAQLTQAMLNTARMA